LAPIEIYAKLGAINQAMITFGILISYISGALVNYNGNHHYYCLFILPLVLSFVQSFIFWKIITIETPTYLMLKNKKEQALALISKLYYNKEEQDISFEISELDFPVNINSLSLADTILNWTRDPALRMGCIMSALQQLTGINFFITSSQDIFKEVTEHIDGDEATIILGVINFVFGSLSMFLLRKHYRINLFYGGIGMALCHFCLMMIWILGFTMECSLKSVFLIANLALSLMFIVCFELSIGPVMWIYCADIISEKGVAITTAVNWICASIVVVFASVMPGEEFCSKSYKPYLYYPPFYLFSIVFCCVVLFI
jgi:hypothetical protein